MESEDQKKIKVLENQVGGDEKSEQEGGTKVENSLAELKLMI